MGGPVDHMEIIHKRDGKPLEGCKPLEPLQVMEQHDLIYILKRLV